MVVSPANKKVHSYPKMGMCLCTQSFKTNYVVIAIRLYRRLLDFRLPMVPAMVADCFIFARLRNSEIRAEQTSRNYGAEKGFAPVELRL